MSTRLGTLYSRLLDAPNPTPLLQMRIFDFASRHKNIELLTKLASHNSLTPEVDEHLSHVSAAPVVAAWVSRQGRDSDAIMKALTSERRPTVLISLAGGAGLPLEVQQTIASRAKSKTVLLTIANNSTMNHEIRLEAAKNLILSSRGEHNEGLDLKRLDMIIDIQKGFIESLADIPEHSDDLEVLYSAATCFELPPEKQMSLVRGFINMNEAKLYEKESPQSHFPGNLIQSQFLDICDEITEKGHVAQDVRVLLEKTIRNVLKVLPKGSYTTTRFEEALDLLRKSSSDRQAQFMAMFNEVDSEVSMASFVNEFLASNNKRQMPQGFIGQVAMLVIGSRHSTTTHQRLAAQLLYRSNVGRVLRSLNDPARAAVVICENSYFNVFDDMLKQCTDPIATLVHIIRMEADEQPYPADTLVTSMYFEPKMVNLLPLETLASTELFELEVANEVEASLLEVLKDHDALQNLEALGDEYSGSFSDLLDVSRVL
jgi:hypothetical protein